MFLKIGNHKWLKSISWKLSTFTEKLTFSFGHEERQRKPKLPMAETATAPEADDAELGKRVREEGAAGEDEAKRAREAAEGAAGAPPAEGAEPATQV